MAQTLTQLTPKIGQRWYADGKIVAFYLQDIGRSTLDDWAHHAGQSLLDWDDDLPFLNLQDFSAVNILTVTPYLRKKTNEITGLRPDKAGRTAVVLPNSAFMLTILQAFLRLLGKSQKTRERRIFTAHDEAVQWLMELV